MRILIADDDVISRQLLEATLKRWGYPVAIASDGNAAWQLLQEDDPPALAFLDWNMPGINGVELCRKVRELPRPQAIYLIVFTGRGSKEDIVTVLDGGADDYIVKPFNPPELQARLRAGLRIVDLQRILADRVSELESTLHQLRQLQMLLPICMYCKKVRDDKNYWQQVEHYIGDHSNIKFSHGICPTCYEARVEPELQRMSSSPMT